MVGFAITLVIGCAAPLESQSTAAFSQAFQCSADRITATPIRVREHTWYLVFEVGGCGYGQTYVCATDFGCVLPNEVPDLAVSAFAFPLTLVDQSPPPPPPPFAAGG